MVRKNSVPILLIGLMLFALTILWYALDGYKTSEVFVTVVVELPTEEALRGPQEVIVVNTPPTSTPTTVPTSTPTLTPTVDIYEGLLPCYSTAVAEGEVCAPIGPSPTPTQVGLPTSTPWIPSCSQMVVGSDDLAAKQKPRPCRKSSNVAEATPIENWVP